MDHGKTKFVDTFDVIINIKKYNAKQNYIRRRLKK